VDMEPAGGANYRHRGADLRQNRHLYRRPLANSSGLVPAPTTKSAYNKLVVVVCSLVGTRVMVRGIRVAGQSIETYPAENYFSQTRGNSPVALDSQRQSCCR